MLSRIEIHNIKVIRELAVDLDPFTVLVGPNACGKSSVLQSIGYVCAMRDTAPEELFVKRNALEHVKTRGVQGPMVLGWRVSGTDFRWQVDDSHDTFNAGQTAPLTADSTRLQTFAPESDAWVDALSVVTELDWWREPLGSDRSDFDASGIPTAIAVHFEFDRLAAPAVMPSGRASIEPDGSGLAAVLAQLALEDRSCFHRIVQSAVQVIPAIRDIRIRNVHVSRPAAEFQRVGLKEEYRRRTRYEDTDIDVPAHELIFDARSGARGIPAHAVSDGTLRLLGLLTIALGPTPPRLLLLDNIERGMHPRALFELVELLRGAQSQEPDLQIVAATHSADLLDYIEPDQIRLLWLGDDGFTRCVRMTEHDKYDEWKALMTPSELWAEIDRAQHPPRGEDA